MPMRFQAPRDDTGDGGAAAQPHAPLCDARARSADAPQPPPPPPHAALLPPRSPAGVAAAEAPAGAACAVSLPLSELAQRGANVPGPGFAAARLRARLLQGAQDEA
jgi:hypothetical protein